MANGQPRQSAVYSMIAISASTIVTLVVSLIYSTHVSNAAVARANEVTTTQTRQFCALMTTLDDTYQQTPPTTDTGRQVAEEVHALRIGLGC